MLNASSDDHRRKALKIASHVLEADVADLEFADGSFTVKGTDRAHRHLRSRCRGARGATICPTNCAGRSGAESDETVNLAAFPYGCHVCEVEIDPETGVVESVRYTAVDDVGRAVNPMIVHGQVHGGIVQGRRPGAQRAMRLRSGERRSC